jgi:hypothetical protein
MVGPGIALILKSVVVPATHSCAFSLFKTETGERGSQFGFAGGWTNEFAIHAYPDEDTHIELHVNAPKSERMLTQREISPHHWLNASFHREIGTLPGVLFQLGAGKQMVPSNGGSSAPEWQRWFLKRTARAPGHPRST